MIVAETERLILRELSMDDLDPLAELFADPEVMRFSLGVKSREKTAEIIEGCIQNYKPERLGFGLYGVIRKEDNAFLGYCGLSRFDDVGGRPEIEIGYRLRRRFWGKGYATEAARAVRDYAFGKLGLRRVISMIEPENMPSVRVAVKNGMHMEKVITKWDLLIHVYAIEKESI